MSAAETQDWSMERRKRSAEPRGGGRVAREIEMEMVGRAEGDGSRFRASISEVVMAVEEDGDEE